jgi:NOL1/NOP2/sun family putative RNA methylase
MSNLAVGNGFSYKYIIAFWTIFFTVFATTLLKGRALFSVIMPTPFPNTKNVHLKDAFVKRYQLLLGEDYDKFMEWSLSYITKAIRVNTLKISVAALQKRLEPRWHLTSIPWCKEGFWITFKGTPDEEERYDLGNLIEHALGYIYVQDPASMIPPVVLHPQPGELVLDLCAAPGSKSSQLASFMHNQGILVANDIKVDRIKALGMNLQRCGVMNVILTKTFGSTMKKSGILFDKVLVDAPCSGTGTIRRNTKILDMWSPGLVGRMVRDQRRLIEEGYALLKPGGVLVYSTCTHEPEENEGMISWFLERHADAQCVQFPLPIKHSSPVLSWEETTYNESVKNCLRIYPYDNDTEGFFVAKIHKGQQHEESD